MKKKIALLLACAALALTACGSSEPTATTAADVSEAESEETAEAETTAAESSEAETESSEAAKEFAEKGKELLVLHSPFSYIAAEHPPQSDRHQYDCYYGDNRPCSLLYYDGSRDRENQSHSDKKYRQLIRAIAP